METVLPFKTVNDVVKEVKENEQLSLLETNNAAVVIAAAEER